MVLKATLPGVSIVYYGEEIGMTNAVEAAQCFDPTFENNTMVNDNKPRPEERMCTVISFLRDFVYLFSFF